MHEVPGPDTFAVSREILADCGLVLQYTRQSQPTLWGRHSMAMMEDVPFLRNVRPF